MNYYIAFTYYTPESLINAYTYDYSELKKYLSLSVIARNINDYNILENLKVDEAPDFFSDSRLLYPFWSTRRGKDFLKTREGHLYLQTTEGQNYIEKYGYDIKQIDSKCKIGKETFPKLIVEKQSDYEDFQRLWVK